VRKASSVKVKTLKFSLVVAPITKTGRLSFSYETLSSPCAYIEVPPCIADPKSVGRFKITQKGSAE
jgi:hypothetical protein